MPTGRRIALAILILIPLIPCARSLAQSFRGEAVPIVQQATPAEFSRLRFLTFVFGREGPMDAPLNSAPVMGREYFVEADVSGIESAASIRFELLDANGRLLQQLTMWKSSDGSADGEFYGFVTAPNQTFRAAISVSLGARRNVSTCRNRASRNTGVPSWYSSKSNCTASGNDQHVPTANACAGNTGSSRASRRSDPVGTVPGLRNRI